MHEFQCVHRHRAEAQQQWEVCDTEDTKEETLKGRSTKVALQCVRFFEKEKGRSETAKKVRIQRRKVDVIDRGTCRRDYRPNRPNTLQDTQEEALKRRSAKVCSAMCEVIREGKTEERDSKEGTIPKVKL